jgi:hypothetical protein
MEKIMRSHSGPGRHHQQRLPALIWSALTFLAGLAVCSTSNAQWGSLKGQVLLDGEMPSLPALIEKGSKSAKDSDVCAAELVPDEKLVVDPSTKGIANVVVFLPKKPAKIHPEQEVSQEKELVFDQKNCIFTPHVMVVRTDQRIRVKSDDPIAHNTHSKPLKNVSENFVVSASDRTGILIKPLSLAEKAPVQVVCDIHPWMSAYWVVLDHPYAAVTDAKGNFEIPNLPTGTHEFMVWQESAGWLNKKLSVTIKEGVNEEKPMKFKASQILK